MKKTKDRLDMLMEDPVKVIREFLPNGDPDSSIPLEWQVISHYSLTDKGIFSFENDADGNFDCISVYPLPFVCWFSDKGNIVFHFILLDQTIEIEGTFDKFIDSYFHSLSPQGKLKVKRYSSVCLMKQLKAI